MTSYHAHIADHYTKVDVGWYKCHRKGLYCVCSRSCECAIFAENEDECFEIRKKFVKSDGNETRYAITQNGERKPMKRCLLGAHTSMKNICRHVVPSCQDAHYLIDGDQVIIDYLDTPLHLAPNTLRRGLKHIRIYMNRGNGTTPAVGFRNFFGRDFKLEVDKAANVAICKLKKRKPSCRYRMYESESSSDESDDYDIKGPTPYQTTLYCNEFCRAVMYEVPALQCFHEQAALAKQRYSFSLAMFVKCMLKWRAHHMTCVSKKWAPGGLFYNQLLMGATAKMMCAPPTGNEVCKEIREEPREEPREEAREEAESVVRLSGKRKERELESLEFAMPVLERPASVDF